MQSKRALFLALIAFLSAAFFSFSTTARGQAALLMEEPYGFFGALNPTGHTAIYFARICSDTPVKVRRCGPGELGSVISRYQGIAGYDWVAMPLVPYLYSVENTADVPDHVNRETVLRLREHYREEHLGVLGADVFAGNLVRGGWTQLVGVSYERRIYVFRFNTTEEQDEALITRLNASDNRSDFDLLYSNCADFARGILNVYFPRTFRRTIFPDAGMTTPRQITFKLDRYAKKHPEIGLDVFMVPQIPGYRRPSRRNKSVAASLATTAYAVPLAIVNPYLAGGIFVDYLVRGRYPLVPKHTTILGPDRLFPLTSPEEVGQNADNAEIQPRPPASTDLPSASAPEIPESKQIVSPNE
ncbi:hypothetical protein DYQ86_26030 [Acidobacteria bacterium AB60]|nr:hypothetical protein DYQ86_26030 [Acidobacteria bacterium AB60]